MLYPENCLNYATSKCSVRLWRNCQKQIDVLQNAKNSDAEKMFSNSEETLFGADGQKNHATRRIATLRCASTDAFCPAAHAEKPLKEKPSTKT
jgi:hypothetical protein